MLKLLSWISLFVLLAVVFGADHENRVWKSKVVSPNATHEFVGNSTTNGAQCYDRRLSSFIDTGLQYYSHDMGKLAQYILDQIRRAGMGNYWLVSADMIQNRRQGLDWQMLSNGDIFATSSRHGCYFHDTLTFVLILHY